MLDFVYPAHFELASEGGYVITFTDFPEAITQAEDLEDAYWQAADCLEEAIAGRITLNKNIPTASSINSKDLHPVACPTQIAAKAALYVAMRNAGLNKVQLAERLHCNEKEVRRMLDPKHPTKIQRIETALHILGKHVVLSIADDLPFAWHAA